jgi:hypothetical protein
MKDKFPAHKKKVNEIRNWTEELHRLPSVAGERERDVVSSKMSRGMLRKVERLEKRCMLR